ncbi:MAG: hypothetical protein H0W83_04320 [Planctomycetes bacterium]|nr:hypothetical protein [Planctomycetota bacterium]
MRNPLGDLNVGVVLAAVGIVLFLVTLSIAWSSWNRWTGIASITTARARLLDGNDAVVKTRSTQAARELPKEAAAVLLDIDLTSPADFTRLEALERTAASRDVPLVRTAEALSLAIRGKEPEKVGGSDGTLIAALVDLNKGSPPHAITLDKESPPHHSVMVIVYAKQLQAALLSGDRALIKDASGVLALLMPAHPEGSALAFINAILDPAMTTELVSQAASRTPDALRQRVARLMAPIVQERSSDLMAISLGIPSHTPADQLLTAQVAAAVAQDGPIDRIALVRRCLDGGRYDLAKSLLPKMPPERQAELRNIIMNQEGNLAELIKAGATDPALKPRLSTLRCRPGFVAFHISNDLGMIPKTGIEASINAQVVLKTAIQQNGSLFTIIVPPAQVGQATLEVRVGDTVLATKQVSL